MMLVKVQCGCGQKYSFDVEPVNGAMPWTVACPVCGTDGTVAANVIIARNLGPSPAAAPAPIRTTAAAPMAVPAPAPIAPVAAPRGPAPIPLTRTSAGGESANDKWKWWYFVLFGIGWGAYAIYQIRYQHSAKYYGEIIFAVLCILIGVWDFSYKRKKKRAQLQQNQQ